jgi:sec-independent protein translocase protein TatC
VSSAEEQQYQTLIEHLTELRKRLVRSFIFILVGFLICWTFSEQIFNLIRAPIVPYLKSVTGGLVFTAPMDKLMAHLKVSALSGVIISCPFWFFELWKFVAPGLYQKEKKWAVGFVSFGSILFVVGVCFAYFLVFPLAFKYLLGFGGDTDVPMITIEDYISFFSTTILVFGLAFEMPLILSFLGMIGIIDAKFLSSKRRFAIVALAAISAIFTPPDVLSMIVMLVPMMGLYEFSIILVRILGKKRQEAQAEL